MKFELKDLIKYEMSPEGEKLSYLCVMLEKIVDGLSHHTARENEYNSIGAKSPAFYDLLIESKKLLDENARLREQLRWHSVDEKPRVGIKESLASVDVILRKPMSLKIIAWYSFVENEWKNVYHERITVSPKSKWCYIPDDKDGDE